MAPAAVARMSGRFAVRTFDPGDAAEVDALLREAFVGHEDEFPGAGAALGLGALRLAQTGSRLLVAEDADGIAGVVRWWDEDGIAWFDLLASYAPGAGRALTQAVERAAQDRGLRLLRCQAPAGEPMEGYFGRSGYLPIARGPALATLEKRLPLLTVREQRRSDAVAIAELTGADPWPFEQGVRPGWFVLSDGERVVGVIQAQERGGGNVTVTKPVVRAGYEGRGLEVWMLERAALYAETNGAHTVEAAAEGGLRRYERALEERRWFLEGAVFRKRL